MDKCIECGNSKLKFEYITMTRSFNDFTFVGKVFCRECTNCHESYVDHAELAFFEKRIAIRIIQEECRVSAAIKFLRKYLGLTFLQLSELFGLAVDHVMLWEQGHPIDQVAWIALTSLVKLKTNLSGAYFTEIEVVNNKLKE